MGEGSDQIGELLANRRWRHLEIQVDVLAGALYLEFSNWNLTHMGDIKILIPGLYTEIRAGSIKQCDLAWGAILKNMFI